MSPPIPPITDTRTLVAVMTAFGADLRAERLEDARLKLRALKQPLGGDTVNYIILEAEYRLASKEPMTALKILTRARKEAPDDHVLLGVLAKTYRNLGRATDADKAFTRARALNANPTANESLEMAGLHAAVLTEHGLLDKARAVFDDIITTVKTRERAKGAAAFPQQPAIPMPDALERVIYLPLEIKKRELHARLLLALEAVHHGGFEAVAAPKTRIQNTLGELPRGVVMFKTANGIDAGHIRHAKERGHGTVGIDEEAFGRIWTASNIPANIHPLALNNLDLLCAQNGRQVAALQTFFADFRPHVAVTGNPRGDLYRESVFSAFAPEARTITAKHGERIILFTSMFGNISQHMRGFDLVVRDLATIAAGPHLGAALEYFRAAIHDELASLNLFTDALLAVAQAFPDHTVILRPHPVESQAYWEKKLRKAKNIVITGEGPIQDWVHAAKAVVFVAGCTTGLEARLHGRPAVRLQSVEASPVLDGCVSAAMGVAARSAEEAVAHVGQALGHADADLTPTETVVIADYVDPGEGSLAARRIVDACVARFSLDAPTSAPLSAERFGALRVAAQEENKSSYINHKMPPTHADEIRGIVDTLTKILGITAATEIIELNESTFLLRAANVRHHPDL